MVDSVKATTANINPTLIEGSTVKPNVQNLDSEKVPQGTDATLAEDSVTLSDEAKAAALGNPDWPKPPQQQ